MDTCRRKELYKQVRAVIKVFLHISVHIGKPPNSVLPLVLNRKAQGKVTPRGPQTKSCTETGTLGEASVHNTSF